MLRSEFAYDLPEELIARYPCERRSDSRLLHVDGDAGTIVDRRFAELPGLLRRRPRPQRHPRAPARLLGRESGGRVGFCSSASSTRIAAAQLQQQASAVGRVSNSRRSPSRRRGTA
jgi:S-adenosylmethionine:tRNA-ribosyltransferase-isomerase (queuine synthetase)